MTDDAKIEELDALLMLACLCMYEHEGVGQCCCEHHRDIVWPDQLTNWWVARQARLRRESEETAERALCKLTAEEVRCLKSAWGVE